MGYEALTARWSGEARSRHGGILGSTRGNIVRNNELTAGINGWRKPDIFVPATDGAALIISTVVGVVLAGIFALSFIGNIHKSNAHHVLQGLPIVFTALGAAMVAIGLALRQWDPAKEADVRYQEWKLQQVMNQRPDFSVGALAQEPAKHESVLDLHQAREDSNADDVVTSKKKAGRWRSIASGVEFAGAVTLLTGAIFGVFAWDLI